jgi:hypothetical protein
MPRRLQSGPVKRGFEEATRRIPISSIKLLKRVSDAVKLTPKYNQIGVSIREVGVVEPPIVTPDRADPEQYLLLDGHLRLEVLKELGRTDVVCIVATDDEAFTYNKRINRIAIIQEHRMILKALERGVSEERLAKVLNVNASHIKRKRHLLDGICPEVAELLKDKHVSINTFWQLKKLLPLRQIEAAELMAAMNKFSIGYAKSLVAASPRAQLVNPDKPKSYRGLSPEQITLMERESANLEREFKLAEQAYGTNHLDLVLAKGYLSRLLANVRIVRYLAQHQAELLTEFQRIAEVETKAVVPATATY